MISNGISKETFKDVRGVITAVKEFNEGATLWTSYEYDSLKQIVTVVDDQDNPTTVSYDNLGRRTQIDSPDMGLTETVYDLASNVRGKSTANWRCCIKKERNKKRRDELQIGYYLATG